MRPSERVSPFEVLSAGGDPPGRDCVGRRMVWERSERSQRSEGIKRELALVAEIEHARAAAKFLKSHWNYRTFVCAADDRNKTQDRGIER